MLKISDVIACLRDCEAVLASKILSDEDKNAILTSLANFIPDPQFCTAGLVAEVIKNAILSQIKEPANGRGSGNSSKSAKAKSGKAQGVENPPEVDAGEDQTSEGPA